MIEALIAGERDPVKLADLAKGRLRVKRLQIWCGRCTTASGNTMRCCCACIWITSVISMLGLPDWMAVLMSCIGPFAQTRQLLMTIPGVGQRVAEVINARDRCRHVDLCQRCASASWAAMCPETTPRPANATQGVLVRAQPGCLQQTGQGLHGSRHLEPERETAHRVWCQPARVDQGYHERGLKPMPGRPPERDEPGRAMSM
jgi:hypothetical protein